jgi:hypothetical protein
MPTKRLPQSITPRSGDTSAHCRAGRKKPGTIAPAQEIESRFGYRLILRRSTPAKPRMPEPNTRTVPAKLSSAFYCEFTLPQYCGSLCTPRKFQAISPDLDAAGRGNTEFAGTFLTAGVKYYWKRHQLHRRGGVADRAD